MKKLKVNKIRCKICREILESKSLHDFVQCSGNHCSIDGGFAYAKRGWDPKLGKYEDIVEDLSEWEEKNNA